MKKKKHTGKEESEVITWAEQKFESHKNILQGLKISRGRWWQKKIKMNK